MNATPLGVYLPTNDPDTYESTHLANAGWYDEGQHGGALAALIGGHVESVPSLAPMQMTRFTMELFRVVPLIPLRIESTVVREGKRIQVIQVRVFGNGEEMTRAYVQRLRLEDVGLPQGVGEEASNLAAPGVLPAVDPDAWAHGPQGKVMAHRNAIEVREIEGGFQVPGPGSIWVRVTTPVIAGKENTPLQRLLFTADFCNGVARLTTEPNWVFMNPDLTVNINRLPTGEWVALKAVSYYSTDGRGIATGTLWDMKSFLGQSTQTLFLDRAEG